LGLIERREIGCWSRGMTRGTAAVWLETELRVGPAAVSCGAFAAGRPRWPRDPGILTSPAPRDVPRRPREGSAFQQRQLVRLAFPFRGVCGRVLAHADHRPVLRQFRVEGDEAF